MAALPATLESLLTDAPNGTDPADLSLTEVINLGSSKGSLDTADIIVVVILLLAVLLVGIFASILANDDNFIRRHTPQAIIDWAERLRPEGTKGAGMMESRVAPMSNRISGNPEYSGDDELQKPPQAAADAGVVADETGGDVVDENMVNRHNDATDFFLADKSMSWWFVGASLFASNIGSEHFVGQSGDGARRGLPVAMYEWYAALLIIALGWIFAPVYRRSGIFTTPEFLEKRFGPWSRHYLSFVTCVIYVVTKLSASIYGGSLVLSTTLGWDLYLSAGVCIFLSCIYTISGGLRAVMYTDLFQTFIFVGGGFVVMGLTLSYVGGYSGLRARLDAQGKSDYMQLWRPASDGEYPWTGMLFGQPFTSIWYWCLDQDLVQRVLSAKDDFQQKAGCSLAATLKIIPPFIMIIPGIVVTTLFRFQYTSESDPRYEDEYSTYLRTDQAYPVILTQLMPSGMRGVMIASIMTAMMSSLDSVFNAGSTIVSNDFYRVWYPEATPKELTRVGRIATITFAVLSFAWIPIILAGDGLYRVVVEIQGYLGPPVGVIVLVAVFIPRVNAWGSFMGLAVGGLMGFIRLFTNVMLKDVVNVDELGFFFTVPFLHFSIIIASTTFLLCFVVSAVTNKDPQDLTRFTFQWNDLFQRHEDSLKYSAQMGYIVNGSGIVVLAATFILWLVFI